MADIPQTTTSEPNHQEITNNTNEESNLNADSISKISEENKLIIVLLGSSLIEMTRELALNIDCEPNTLVTSYLFASSYSIHCEGLDKAIKALSIDFPWLIDFLKSNSSL